VRRVTEESLDQDNDDGVSTDKLFEPPEHVERPPVPESTNTVVAAGADRGRTIAKVTLAGLVGLGFVLIARGPQSPPQGAPSQAPVPLLTGAELPSDPVAAPVVSVPAAAADAGPKFTPVWRVASLGHESGGTELVKGTLGKHTFAGALAQAGISRNEVRRVTHAIDGIRRIEHGSSKDAFVIARDRMTGTITAFEYIASPTEVWQAKSDQGKSELLTKKLELFVEKKRAQAALVVTADLRKAIGAAGLREEAIEEIDDALEGQGDAAQIKPGVRLRVVGNEEWVEGAFARFRVDAIEYVPKLGATLRVYFYERDSSVEGSRRRTPHPGFYDVHGRQPFRGTFRSPLPLARMTSRFNPKRMHPVLHVVMPHNGVDFGAASGTPVYASATGTVHSAGDGGPCGNMVQIEHTNGLTTAYCHLSRFAPGLHPGQHVEARQLVGFVGQTGRATGPHLHFAVKRGGNFIDPMALKMDGVRTLPPADRDAFAKRRVELDAVLEAITDDKDEPGGEE
jgi:murein DD-endopeptidase MepM/ murein hydrolase activator NlpD